MVQAARYIRLKLVTSSPLSILIGFFKITGADGEGFSTGAFDATPGEEEMVAEAWETPGEDVEEFQATEDTCVSFPCEPLNCAAIQRKIPTGYT